MKILVLFLLIAVGVAACGRASDDYAHWHDSSGILRFIPADSPLVAVRLAPFPDAFRQRFSTQRALLAAQNRDAWDALMQRQATESGTDAFAGRVMEMLQQLNRISTAEGAAEAGIAPDGAAAFYWVRSQPVFRVTLNDPEAFEDFVANLAEMGSDPDLTAKLRSELGSVPEFSVGEIDGTRLRYAQWGGMRVALLIDEQFAVVTPAPSSAGEATLTAQLGLVLPTRNVAASGVLGELAEKHGLTGMQLATMRPADVFDVVLASDGLLHQFAQAGASSGQGAQTLAAVMSDDCRADLRRGQSSVTAITLGYSEAGAEGLKAAVAVDLEPNLARDLIGLAQPVPGLGVPTQALLSLGISLDVETLRAFVENRAKAVLEDPFECPQLSQLNKQAERLSDLLDRQPIPPSARDFRGLSVSVERFSETPGSALEALADLSLSWILSMKNPNSLVTMGNLFVPQIAALELEPDGQPVDVPQGVLNPTGQRLTLAMTDRRLVGVLGAGDEARVPELLAMPDNADAPVFAVDVDAGAYLDMFGELLLGASPENAALQDALGSLYDRQSMRVKTTKNGVRVDFEMTLKKEVN